MPPSPTTHARGHVAHGGVEADEDAAREDRKADRDFLNVRDGVEESFDGRVVESVPGVDGEAQAVDHALVNTTMLDGTYRLHMEFARINADFGEDNAGDFTVPMRVMPASVTPRWTG